MENNRKKPIIMSLKGNMSNSRSGKKRINNGFGMWGYSGAKFYVNGDVYPRFRCVVGIPSNIKMPDRFKTEFKIEIDCDINEVCSEVMEYKAECLLKFPLLPGNARRVDVDIKGARSLILSAKSCPVENGTTGRIEFNIPHAAVCFPELLKR